ncbi:MAG: MgtC/SapB family protein [Candidatus Nanohaloarchaea archaeon]
MLVPELLTEILMSIGAGGLIGLERENAPERKYAGIRTLSLLGGAGPGVVLLSEKAGSAIFVAIYLALVSAISLGIVLIRLRAQGEDIGFTTSVAVFVVAVLGTLIGYDMYFEATSLAILTALILAEKKALHGYIDKLSDRDISSALQLSAVAFILLPILPATAVDPLGAIVPRDIVLLAVFVMAIEFASYVLMRQLGGSGIYLTGLLGGGASSFATTGVLARIGLKEELGNPASAAVMLSATSMLARNIGIAAVIMLPQMAATGGLYALFASGMAMGVVLLAAAFLLKKEASTREIGIEIESPFSLKSGVKFATIFTAVSAASALGQDFAGATGSYLTALVGGMASSSAVAASAATSYGAGAISVEVATGMVIVSIAGSLLSKIGLVELINHDIATRTALPLISACAAGITIFLAIQ